MLDAAEKFVRGQLLARARSSWNAWSPTDEVYLIEINPRFPAWVYLATGVGLNLPSQLLRCSLGLPPAAAADYEAGKLFVRYSYDLVTDMAPFQKP